MQQVAAAVIIACAALTGGCATIVHGTSQQVSINSAPSGAQCNLVREGQPIGNVAQTPETMTLTKSVHDIYVDCGLPGRKQRGTATLQSTLVPAVAGNFLIGGVIGAGVDAASGAMNKYPASVTVKIPAGGAPARRKRPRAIPDQYRSREKPTT